MVTVSNRQRNCSKCSKELVNANGVHLGTPFGIWQERLPDDGWQKWLLCARCYDQVTIKDNVQRTGEDVI